MEKLHSFFRLRGFTIWSSVTTRSSGDLAGTTGFQKHTLGCSTQWMNHEPSTLSNCLLWTQHKLPSSSKGINLLCGNTNHSIPFESTIRQRLQENEKVAQVQQDTIESMNLKVRVAVRAPMWGPMWSHVVPGGGCKWPDQADYAVWGAIGGDVCLVMQGSGRFLVFGRKDLARWHSRNVI